jgi:hypothetical protein
VIVDGGTITPQKSPSARVRHRHLFEDGGKLGLDGMIDDDAARGRGWRAL